MTSRNTGQISGSGDDEADPYAVWEPDFCAWADVPGHRDGADIPHQSAPDDVIESLSDPDGTFLAFAVVRYDDRRLDDTVRRGDVGIAVMTRAGREPDVYRGEDAARAAAALQRAVDLWRLHTGQDITAGQRPG